jgi:signal transduction histidine kinase/CheY-like chemotaxis protein
LKSVSKTLAEIRSEACNTILVALTVLAAPAVGASLLRATEQGWQPVMGLHVALLLVLGAMTLGRHRLSFAIRAATVTAVPFVIALAGLLTYGRGNGVLMFFVTSAVLAGCFFSRRIAFGVVGLTVATLMAIYLGDRSGIIALGLESASYDQTPLSWLALSAGFVFAGGAPIIALSAVYRALEEERRRADAALAVRSEFLARMSHELRTPMTGIIGMAELMADSGLTAQQKTINENLLRSADNLMVLLNDLLDFAKIDAGKLVIEKAPFVLSTTVRHVRDLFLPAATRKGLTLELVMPETFQDHLVGDGYRIGQVLANLISNAIKFTATGTVQIRVELAASEAGEMMLTCAVTDTGIGIPPDQIPQLFQPFVQADTSTSRLYGGSGLGLAICRNVIDALGGEIYVSSSPGSGSTFSFTVPVEAATPAPVRREDDPAPARKPIPSPQDGLRVLLAEDDSALRLLVSAVLGRAGHTVTVVEDGAAAVRSAADTSYDVIVMDMHMPVMSGADAMRAIRESGNGTPLIALTADLIPEHRRAFLAAGADAVVPKPVDWDVLTSEIQRLARTRAVPA